MNNTNQFFKKTCEREAEIAERRLLFYAAYRERARDWMTPDGDWTAEHADISGLGADANTLRQRYFHARAFLESEDPTDWLRVMRTLERPEHYRCSFAPAAALEILVRHADKLTADAHSQLTAYLAENLPQCATRDFQFHGYNDNMPAIKTFVLIVGGELLGEPRFIEEGLSNLAQLRSHFLRRGLLSEHTSSDYTPTSLYGLASIVNMAKSEPARELALAAEQRVWADVATHWHPATCGLSGPLSRAYTSHSIGHWGSLHAVMWLLLGEQVFINPLRNLLGADASDTFFHMNRADDCLARLVWFCGADYHPPEGLLEQATGPRTVIADSDCGPNHDSKTTVRADGKYSISELSDIHFSGHPVHCTSYLEPRFALGSADTTWLTGSQQEQVFYQFSTKEEPKGIRDIRTVYTRYLMGQKYYANFEGSSWPEGTVPAPYNLPSDSTAFSVQKDKTVLFASCPRPCRPEEKVDLLAQRLLFYRPNGGPDRIEIDGRAVEEGEFERPDHILVEEAGLFLLIRPLVQNIGQNLPGGGRVRVFRDAAWLCIDLINYSGPARHFTGSEVSRILNGFVWEVGACPVPAHLWEAKIDQTSYFDQRRIRYNREGLEMVLVGDHRGQSIRTATINGAVPKSAPLQADCFDLSSIPWMSSKEPRPPENLDWWQRIESRPFPFVNMGDDE